MIIVIPLPLSLRENIQMKRAGIIFDMDGVITNTRREHFRAWKETFDSFLSGRRSPGLFTESDYQNYVDGKPREVGITSFLSSRNLMFTIHDVENIGREKNKKFLHLLKSSTSLIYPEVLPVLNVLKKHKIPLALITSSKNAHEILQQTGLDNIFDVMIDRNEGDRLGLKGKPAPDYFLEAARRMGLGPEQCMVVEDSIAGVQAGASGGFLNTVGISRDDQTPSGKLIASGADFVVHNLEEVLPKVRRIHGRMDVEVRGV